MTRRRSYSKKRRSRKKRLSSKTRKEKLLKIIISPNKDKKYRAIVKNNKTGRIRNIDFGDSKYEQYMDTTPLKKYKMKNHYNKKRRTNYFNRHSGTSTKKDALKKEWRHSKGRYTPKILSHKYLW